MPTPFRTAVEADDWDRAVGLLHPDVVFRSPAVHQPYRGSTACGHLLRHVARVFTDFRYVDEIDGGDRVALLFEAVVEGLVALATTMGARLEADPVPGAS